MWLFTPPKRKSCSREAPRFRVTPISCMKNEIGSSGSMTRVPTWLTTKIMPVDVAEIRVAQRSQQGVEHLAEQISHAAVARDCPMTCFVREETGLHADERKRDDRSRACGNAGAGQQRRVAGRVARQDECAAGSAARRDRKSTR